MRQTIIISEEDIRGFKEHIANTDEWMIYSFKIFVDFPQGRVKTDAQIFLDIPNIINAIDSLLLFKKGAILFDSGGKYSIGFDVLDDDNISVWVANGDKKSIKVKTSEFLDNILALLFKIRDIANAVKDPSRELIDQIYLLNIYLYLINLYLNRE